MLAIPGVTSLLLWEHFMRDICHRKQYDVTPLTGSTMTSCYTTGVYHTLGYTGGWFTPLKAKEIPALYRLVPLACYIGQQAGRY